MPIKQPFRHDSRILNHVYHVGSGTSPVNANRPSSASLYATGSCKECVRISLQNRSRPTFLPVARAPVVSKTPDVTRRPVSVATIFTLATHSATSPRCRAVMSRCSLWLLYMAAISRPALSANASAARR